MATTKADLLADEPDKADEDSQDANVPLHQSAEVQAALAKLKPVHAKFAVNLAAGMVPADAYFEAMGGKSKANRNTLTSHAGRLLRGSPEIQDAINLMKAELAKKAEYSFNAFMEEMDAAMQFARDTKNATALVRAIELKGKASGHIVDRVDQKVSGAGGFSLVVAGVAPPRVVSEQ